MREFYVTKSDSGLQQFYYDAEYLRKSEVKRHNFIENYAELFTKYRRNVGIGCGLQVLQQVCGVNVVLFYGPEVLRDAGFGGDMKEQTVLTGFLFLGALNFLGTLVALLRVDSLGRRFLLLRCLPFLILSMFLLAISMFLHHRYDYTKSIFTLS